MIRFVFKGFRHSELTIGLHNIPHFRVYHITITAATTLELNTKAPLIMLVLQS